MVNPMPSFLLKQMRKKLIELCPRLQNVSPYTEKIIWYMILALLRNLHLMSIRKAIIRAEMLHAYLLKIKRLNEISFPLKQWRLMAMITVAYCMKKNVMYWVVLSQTTFKDVKKNHDYEHVVKSIIRLHEHLFELNTIQILREVELYANRNSTIPTSLADILGTISEQQPQPDKEISYGFGRTRCEEKSKRIGEEYPTGVLSLISFSSKDSGNDPIGMINPGCSKVSADDEGNSALGKRSLSKCEELDTPDTRCGSFCKRHQPTSIPMIPSTGP